MARRQEGLVVDRLLSECGEKFKQTYWRRKLFEILKTYQHHRKGGSIPTTNPDREREVRMEGDWKTIALAVLKEHEGWGGEDGQMALEEVREGLRKTLDDFLAILEDGESWSFLCGCLSV